MKLFGGGSGARRVRRWTLLVVSEHENRARQYTLSERGLKTGLAGMGLFVLTISTVLAGFFVQADGHVATRELARENELLEQEVAEHRRTLDELGGTLEDLRKRDAEFRAVAGLDPMSPAMYSAGVGGPSSEDRIRRIQSAAGSAAASNAFDLDAISRRVRVLRSSWSQAVAALRERQDEMAAMPSILPTYGYLSSAFSRSRWHPILDEDRPHAGIDIAAPTGTPVFAAAHGRVVFVGDRGQYGLMVEIDHGHGYVTRYAHLHSSLVRIGEAVERRSRIGTVGETGLAIGPHLHYEVLVNGVAKNPVGYIFDRTEIPD